MQPIAAPEIDPATTVTPPIRSAAPWRVHSVKALSHLRLRVTFVDETAGEVDMRRFLSDPKVQGTVFEALREPTLFRRAQVALGAVRWPNGADLAPDAMYDAIREGGRWVPD